MEPPDPDQLAQKTREAFRALPAKHRAQIFKKAPPDSSALDALLHAAHIPPSFQPARIAHWLSIDHQHKLEQLMLLPEHQKALERLLRHFFIIAHRAMNDLFLSLIDPKGTAPKTFEQAFSTVEQRFPQDPYLSLYLAATRWLSHHEMIAHDKHIAEAVAGQHHSHSPPQKTGATSLPGDAASPAYTTFSELDKQLQLVSATVASLQAVLPTEVGPAVAALQRAHALTTSLAQELKSSASEAAEPEPNWSSRHEFVAQRDRIADLVTDRTKMLQRASLLAESSTKLLAGAVVRHRLPSRSITLTELAHRSANDLRQNAPALATLLMNHSGDAVDWFKWLWKQEGADAENLQQKLRPISPALADLLADASWQDLQWPEPAPTGAPAPEVHQPPAPQATPQSPTQPVAPAAQPDATPAAAPAATAEKPKTLVAPSAPQQRAPEPPAPMPASASAAPQRPPATRQPVSPKPAAVEAPTAPEQKPPLSVAAPIAETAPPLAPAEDRSPIAADVWRLAAAKRWGLASHVATLSASGELPPPWLFEAAAIAPRINYEVSALSERLTELFMRSADFRVDSLRPEVRAVARLLLAAVALRPALLAPKTGAVSLLKLSDLTTVPRLLAVAQLVEAVAEFGLHRQALQPDMLRSSHNAADWERQLEQVRAEINQWLEQAPLRGFNYAIAGRIWRKWTTHNGSLRQLLHETANAAPRQVAAIKPRWEPWTWRAGDLVQTGMREFNHRKTMDGTARDTLIARIGEAVRLAERIFALLSQHPQPAGTFRHEQVHLLLAARRRHLPAARRELKALVASSSDDATIAAAGLCDESLEQVDDLLQGHLPLPGGDEPNPRWILDAELLRDPAFALAPDGTLIPPDESQREALLKLARTPTDWIAAWNRQIDARSHLASAALLEFFRWQRPPGLDIAALEQQRDRELEATRHRMKTEADDTRRLLDDFARLGLCREQDYTNWTAEVESVDRTIPSTIDFAPLRNRLGNIRQKVEQQRKTEADRVRQQLNSLPDVTSDDRNRIAALLDSGDIHTATDYLDRLTRKIPLPQPGSSPSTSLAYFGTDGWLSKADPALASAIPPECVQAVLDGKPWNHMDFQLLTPEHRLSVATQLELWATLEGKPRPDEADVLKLASALGLQPTKVTKQQGRTGTHIVQPFLVQAQVLDDRRSAVVPAFGSETRGNYTFQFLWGEPSAEELPNLCRREIGDNSAHIVVNFRLLTAKDRHDLAEEARKPERSFKAIVIDRALFTFACAQPGSRFSTLLKCALPFSCVEPYTITAGDVPPEMFYGRGRELHSLADPRGSCFVYGGRQLGKTALLRALERRFHNPKQGRAAVFVDLKRELFSRARGIDALWSVLVSRLQTAGVLSDTKVGASAGPDALSRHINEWIAGSPDRRLLLLLDEADTFLEEDGKETEDHEPFPRCQRLKGLMEDTGRRFKVIFAGLHNVQRTTRTANHPLAHFGEAICIGPMLEEAESREARALVEEPLAAAGYFFQSTEVVSKILALSNYYPSLIQIFCYHLLADLRANHVTRFRNPRGTPPCIVTSDHVMTAYRSRVQDQIHLKVGLTLDLDKRYRVIALVIAFYDAAGDGVPLRDIRAAAAEHWPAGFNEMRTDDEFRSLLEEMVGLGILRQIPETGKFALRNQNVTTLLGNPEQIERQLVEATNWEPALKYEADTFRRLLTERPRLTFSPLTTQQESELKASENRVAILYGLPAAGLASVRTAMESDTLFGKKIFTLRDCPDANTLSERINRVDRKPQTNSIFLVPADLHWDESWVVAAGARLESFTSKDAFLTVLFIADPHRTAATLQGLDGAAETGIRELTLRPWHDAAVRHWLEELGIGADQNGESTRRAIKAATGNWPELLMRLNTSNREALLHACDDMDSLFSNRLELIKLRAAFGFDDPSAEHPLRVAAQLEEFTVEDVCDYAEAPDEEARERIARCIAWADRLGLITLSGLKRAMDPIAAKILLSPIEAA